MPWVKGSTLTDKVLVRLVTSNKWKDGNDVKWKLGVNTNTKNWPPREFRCSSGLEFSLIEYVWQDTNEDILASPLALVYLTVDPNEVVWEEKGEPGRYSAIKVTVTRIQPLAELSDQELDDMADKYHDRRWKRGSEKSLVETLEERLKRSGLLIREVPKEMRDLGMCELACTSDGWALQFVPDQHKTEPVCWAACRSRPTALQYVPKPLRTKELCMDCFKRDLYVLKYADGVITWDMFTETEIMQLMHTCGHQLAAVPKALRTFGVCLAAVGNCGCSITAVPKEFRTEDVCMEAVRNDPMAVNSMNRQDITKKVAEYCVTHDGQTLEAIVSCADQQIVTAKLCLLACQNDGTAIEHVPLEFLKSKIKKTALAQNPHANWFLPKY